MKNRKSGSGPLVPYSSGIISPEEVHRRHYQRLNQALAALVVFLQCLANAEKNHAFLTAAAVKLKISELSTSTLEELFDLVVQMGDADLAHNLLNKFLERLRTMNEDDQEDFLGEFLGRLQAVCSILGNDPVADRVYEALATVSPDEDSRESLRINKTLRLAEAALQDKRFNEAARKALPIARNDDESPSVRAEAHSIMARVFRALGDVKREMASICDWHVCFEEMGFEDGPIGFIASVLDGDGIIGPTARERADRNLHLLSRLAEIFDKMGDRQSSAKIYGPLLDLGYHEWVDETMDDPCSIRVRATLASEETPNTQALPAESPTLEVLLPSTDRYRMSEDDGARLVGRLYESSASCEQALRLSQVKISRNIFDFSDQSNRLVSRLSAELEKAREHKDFSALGFQFRSARASFGQTGNALVDLFVLSHRLDAPEISGIVFLLRPLLIGMKVEFSLHAAALSSTAGNSAYRRRLISMMVSGTDNVPGFQILQSTLVDLVTRAGGRLNEGSAD